jgi:hypothetical protein
MGSLLRRDPITGTGLLGEDGQGSPWGTSSFMRPSVERGSSGYLRSGHAGR